MNGRAGSVNGHLNGIKTQAALSRAEGGNDLFIDERAVREYAVAHAVFDETVDESEQIRACEYFAPGKGQSMHADTARFGKKIPPASCRQVIERRHLVCVKTVPAAQVAFSRQADFQLIGCRG
jgi:hypothetical protein